MGEAEARERCSGFEEGELKGASLRLRETERQRAGRAGASGQRPRERGRTGLGR